MMMREVAIVMLLGIAIAIPAYMVWPATSGRTLRHSSPAILSTCGCGFVFSRLVDRGYIPSRRALRVDPIRVLRYEDLQGENGS